MNNMTIAQRAAQAEKQRTEAYLRNQESARMQAARWNGLDSLGQRETMINDSSREHYADGDEDDILGVLSRPVDAVVSKSFSPI